MSPIGWSCQLFCWIVLYLAVVLVFKYSANTIRKKCEICGLTVILVLPFLFNWVPFSEKTCMAYQGEIAG